MMTGLHLKKANRNNLYLMIGIMLVSANLRAPLTSVGPLLGFIRDDTTLSNSLTGLITTLPLLGFALFSPFAPKLGNRFGLEKSILISLIVLTVGTVLRSTPSVEMLFIGTALIGLAIAVGNVLIPSLIKREFPLKVGLVTGLYTMSMSIFATTASGITVPFANILPLGWRGSLSIWALLSLATFFIWLPHTRKKEKPGYMKLPKTKTQKVWSSPLAWQVTFFMGLQSFGFYVCITWLPQILYDKGLSIQSAGGMLSLMQIVSIPLMFIVPILAGKMKNQLLFVTTAALLLLTGYSGIMLGGTSYISIWVILMGLGHGFSLSLALMFFVLRSNNPYEAAALSGMAQSIGYLLAAVGPLIFGVLYDFTNMWTIPLILLLVTTTLQFLSGMGAGRNRTISSRDTKRSSVEKLA